MQDEISVVVVSRDPDSPERGIAQHIQDTCGFPVKIFFVVNPAGVGLASIYHDMLRDLKSKYIVFLHDDVKFLRNGWGAELARIFDENPEYGILGVAGSATFDKKGAWWLCDRRFGQVLHRHDGKSWLSAFSPLLDHDVEEVCVIDGLFIGVCKDRVKVNFDNTLSGFDFYDIDFCLGNFFDKSCKIGVTTNIRVAHESIGELKDSWYVNKDIIMEKYNGKIPVSVNNKKKK